MLLYEVICKGRQRIHVLVKKETMMMGQATDLQNECVALQKQITGYQQLQTIYMPGVIMKVAEEDTSDGKYNVEDFQLWLPSKLSVKLRVHGCHKGLAFMEEQLRESQ
jgi:hypothetical protein